MASAKLISARRWPRRSESISLTLSRDEAETLMAIDYVVGGFGPRRRHTWAIREAIRDVFQCGWDDYPIEERIFENDMHRKSKVRFTNSLTTGENN